MRAKEEKMAVSDDNPPPYDAHTPARPLETADDKTGITCAACGHWYETWPPCACQSCEGRVCIFCGKPSVVRTVQHEPE